MTKETPPPRRADAERNRRRLVAAATRTLAAQPAASLDDVAAAADLTRTTVYRHFPNREALVTAVYVEALAAVSRALDEARLDQGSVDEALARALDAMLAVADEYAVLANGPSTDVNDPALLAGYDEAMSAVVGLVERGQRGGELAADLPAWWIADALFALVLAALARLVSGELERDAVAPLVLRSLRTGARPA